MNHFLRPCWNLHLSRNIHLISCAALIGLGAALAVGPPAAETQAQQVTQIFENPKPLLASAEGYLGIDVTDVNAKKAHALKLKAARGAVITLIDHDAPAGQVGLKINDVVLQLDGQNVESAEQLRGMLREIPPGRMITMMISRDGNIKTLNVKLADRRAIENETWDRIGEGGDVFTPTPEMGMLAGSGGDAPAGGGGGFHFPFFGSSLNVGALVEPLTSQMAGYLGVAGGVMVKQVARGSEAAAAGLRAFDVIVKVGSESIANLADWGRALHANEGKPVQVIILRDRKQEMLTLQVDSKHHRGAMNDEELLPAGDRSLAAGLV